LGEISNPDKLQREGVKEYSLDFFNPDDLYTQELVETAEDSGKGFGVGGFLL